MSLTKTYITVAIILGILTAIELMIFGRSDMPSRTNVLLGLMTAKALLVALVYMNLKGEPLTIKISFFILIPVGLYFLLFMLYDAAYIWKS